MSKLNANNLDVQRMQNVLRETYAKIVICSLFSYEALNETLDKVRPLIKNEELLKDIQQHQEKIIAFHDNRIVMPDDQKEDDKASADEDEFLDDEGQPKDKENVKKEVTDLKGLDENAPEAVDLAKSIRNFCRKYYHDKDLLKLINSQKKSDEKIQDFLADFENRFSKHYEKFVQMTLEEELSESNLNVTLKAKIEDLKSQIEFKKDKLQKLKKDREDFNNRCNQEIQAIKSAMEGLKKETKNKLDEYTEEINKELNRLKEENDKRLKGLVDQREEAKKLLAVQNDNDIKSEGIIKGNYLKARQNYSLAVNEYDNRLKGRKADFIRDTKIKEKNEIDYKTQKIEFDAVESKYNFLKENFLITQQKCKDVAYDEEVKQKAVEWMQAQFRGFWTRKTMRKKFKFLNVLRAPKKMAQDEGEGGKKKKKG